MTIYHGGHCEIKKPEIRIAKHNKDFRHGFYCTALQAQADKWAKRFDTPIVSVYEYTPSVALNLLKFDYARSRNTINTRINKPRRKEHGYENRNRKRKTGI